MTRGNFTIAFLDVGIDKDPKEVQKRFGSPEYGMRIIGEDNTGRVYPIPKAEAERMAKKIKAFRRKINAEMLTAAEKYRAGKR
jgi:hypothetical protein